MVRQAHTFASPPLFYQHTYQKAILYNKTLAVLVLIEGLGILKYLLTVDLTVGGAGKGR